VPAQAPWPARELLADPLAPAAPASLAKPVREALVQVELLAPLRAVERARGALSVRVERRQERAVPAWLRVAVVRLEWASVDLRLELVAQRAELELAAELQARLEPAR
jgi:hypothetical protein